MKRTYLSKSNALFSSANFSWGAYALIFAVFILFLRLLAPNLFWSAFAPIFRASDAAALKSRTFFSAFGDTAALALRNEKLKEENTALALRNYALLKKIESLSGLQSSADEPVRHARALCRRRGRSQARNGSVRRGRYTARRHIRRG